MDAFLTGWNYYILAVVCFTGLLLFSSLLTGALRRWRKLHHDRTEQRYGLKVMQASITEPGEQEAPDLPRWARKPFRRLLLNRLFRHSGMARRNLVAFYRRLGYVDKDVAHLKHATFEQRIEAAAVIGFVGEPKHADKLKLLLEDRSEVVRLTAARSLVRLEIFDWLEQIPALARSLGPMASRRLVATVSAYGDKLDPVIEQMLALPATGSLRIFAIDLIGRAGLSGHADKLIAMASGDDVEERVHIARSLGKLDGDAVEAQLIEMISDEEWIVRAQAAKSLGLRRSAAAVKQLAGGLTDQSWWVRFNCARSLIRLGDIGRKVLEEAQKWPDRFARDISRQALETAPLLAVEEDEY